MSKTKTNNLLLEVTSLCMIVSQKYIEPYSHRNSPQKFIQAHRLKVAEQVSPVESMTMLIQMSLGRVAITANNAPKLITQQFRHHSARASAVNRKQRAGSTNDCPQQGFQAVFTPARA